MEWQPLTLKDMDQVNSLADQIHIDLPESPEVFSEKVALFPDGCRKATENDSIIAYGIAHPWSLYSIPTLNEFLLFIPTNPNCLYIHDVVVLPKARGHNLAGRFVDYIKQLARNLNISYIALVSVYGTNVLWSRFGFKEYTTNELDTKLLSYGPSAKYMICDISHE